MSGETIDFNQRDSIVTIWLCSGHYRSLYVFVLTFCLCWKISIFVRIYLTSQKKNSMHEEL